MIQKESWETAAQFAQRQKDFDYDQWVEGRDWDKNQTMFASNVLGGAPTGSTTTSTMEKLINNFL